MIAFIYGFFEIMATFVESYFAFRFNDLFVMQDIEKKKSVIMAAILTVFIFLINFFNLFSLITLVSALLFVALSNRFLFKVPFFDTFSITAFFSFFIVFIDFFSMSVMGFLLGDYKFAADVVTVQSGYRCAFLLISKAILVIVYFTVRRLLFRLNKLKSRNLLLITILGYIGVCYYAKFTFEQINFNIIVSWFVLFTVVVLFLFSLSVLICYQKAEEGKRIIEVRNSAIAASYMDLTKYCQGNAQLYHDMKHHMMVLKELLESKKYQEAEKYLDELSEAAVVLEYTWTGNAIVDCILNNKKAACEQANIHIIIDVDPIDTELLDGVTVSTILSNLLDNAIEACQKFNEGIPYIQIAIRHINDMIFVKIQNSASGLSISKNGVLTTTKNNKDKLHGWGLKSVEATVNKVGGIFQYSCQNGEFVSIVTLFL